MVLVLVFAGLLRPLLPPACEGETGKQSNKLPAVSLGDDLRVWQVPLIGAMTLEAVNNLVRLSVTKRSGPANVSQIDIARFTHGGKIPRARCGVFYFHTSNYTTKPEQSCKNLLTIPTHTETATHAQPTPERKANAPC